MVGREGVGWHWGGRDGLTVRSRTPLDPSTELRVSGPTPGDGFRLSAAGMIRLWRTGSPRDGWAGMAMLESGLDRGERNRLDRATFRRGIWKPMSY